MAKTAKNNPPPVEEVTNAENRKIAIDKAINDIEKQFGKGSIQTLDAKPMKFPHLPTGIMSLDTALGIGGLPKGRIVEIFGPEAAGKTLICLQTVAEVQQNGGVCAFIDVEHALNVGFAQNVGVITENLYVSQPDSGEQALEIVEKLVRSGGFDLVVIDSVAALTPQAEINGEMGDSHVGLLARLMSQALRKLTSIADKTGTTLIFVNQLREKVGVIYGNPETTPGGRALKYYATVRLDVRKVEPIKNEKSEIIGMKTKAKVVKNKVGPPFKEAIFELMFASGASKEGAIIDMAVDLEIIEKSGAWFSYREIRLGQGREKVKKYFEENPETYAEIKAEIENVLYPTEEKESL